jgi:hypothetical protein
MWWSQSTIALFNTWHKVRVKPKDSGGKMMHHKQNVDALHHQLLSGGQLQMSHIISPSILSFTKDFLSSHVPLSSIIFPIALEGDFYT